MSIRRGHARWAFDLSAWRPNRHDLLLATACVQPEEKERLAKFVFRNDFDASLIGRLLLRKFVNDSTNSPYESIRFERDARGRPCLGGALRGHPIDFNVSHQGNYAVLAGLVATDTTRKVEPLKTRVGVDVMKIEYTGGKPLHEFFRIMHRNFSPTEWSYIRSRSGGEWAETQAFMRHWCLKESYVKNIGVGITVDLQSISFSVNTPVLSTQSAVTDTRLSVDNVPMDNWLFEETLLDNEHCVAVALHGANGFRVEPLATTPFEVISFEDLMQNSSALLEPDNVYCENVLNKDYKTYI